MIAMPQSSTPTLSLNDSATRILEHRSSAAKDEASPRDAREEKWHLHGEHAAARATERNTGAFPERAGRIAQIERRQTRRARRIAIENQDTRQIGGRRTCGREPIETEEEFSIVLTS